MYKRTYSLRKPNNEISKAGIDHQNDLLFNEIVLKGTSSDDSPSRPHKQPKPKNKEVRKHSSKIRKRNLQDSFELFKDNFLGKKKDGGHVAKHSVAKRGKLKEISSMIETLSGSDGDGNSELLMFAVDKFSACSESIPNCKTVSKLQCQPPKVNASSHLELNLNESIEIARESKDVSRWSTKGLHYSPPVKVVQSDDESFSSAHQSGQKKKLVSSEEKWVTISSDSKGTRSYYTDTGSSQKMSQSKYTYSYVSTYTDNTVTSKASSNDRTSPHVVIKKLQPKLNSTTCWDKDDIGTVQFPDFISPIEVKPIPPGGKTPNWNNQIAKKKCEGKGEPNPEPKCSTQLFVSISSSQTKMLHSLSLSAIQEASKTRVDVHHQEEPTPKIYNRQSTIVELNQDTIKADKEGEWFKSSTPHYHNVLLTLDLSPIKSPIFDDDELCINYSVEENTDEIIVPSLVQLSHLSEESHPPCSDDEVKGLHGNKVECNVQNLISDDEENGLDGNKVECNVQNLISDDEENGLDGNKVECNVQNLISDDEENGLDGNKVECKVQNLISDDNGNKRDQNKQRHVELNSAILERIPDQIEHFDDSCSSGPLDDQLVKGADNTQCVKGANSTESDCDSIYETLLSRGDNKKKGPKCPPLEDSDEHTEAPDDNVCADENEAIDTSAEKNCRDNSPIQSSERDEEVKQQDSGCSKCLSHFNRGWFRGVCFVSKLCLSSQSVLKQSP